MNNSIQIHVKKKVLLPFYLIICINVCYLSVYGQENPPKPITVTVSISQHLNFGTFIQAGNFGTITVTHDGARTATGSVIIPNISSIVTPALFEVYALPGTVITIINGPEASLTGTNGGSIVLNLEDSSTGSPFIATNDRTDVFIGGTLTVSSLLDNPSGEYSGSFQVIFIQQ
jgi:hypothetical protein